MLLAPCAVAFLLLSGVPQSSPDPTAWDASERLDRLNWPIRGGGCHSVFGARFGQTRRLLAHRGGRGEETEKALRAALVWLARHQSPDGSWRVQEYVRQCKEPNCSPNPGHPEFDTGVTALALLAFLGAGYSPHWKEKNEGIPFHDVVRKGLTWLVRQQHRDGSVGPRGAFKRIYIHAIATTALVEAYGITDSMILREPARKALDFLVAAQNPGKGWSYVPRSGRNDSSVTGWAVLAIRAADLSGLRVPAAARAGAVAWFDEATDAKGRTGYTRAGTGKVFIPGT